MEAYYVQALGFGPVANTALAIKIIRTEEHKYFAKAYLWKESRPNKIGGLSPI